MGKPLLVPIKAKPGEPRYQAVKAAVRSAIDTGVFSAGERLPSTKAIALQLGVSLVTVHRALQELVGVGVLRRGQGRGTYVHEEYRERATMSTGLRFGLVFHAECSLADSYHGLILEGVRQGADEYGADLVLLHFGEDWRKECQGFLYVNPYADQLQRSPIYVEHAARIEQSLRAEPLRNGQTRRERPIMVVGASFERMGVGCVDADNYDIARQAVEHLFALGHRRLLYVGGGDHIANNADRYRGFVETCKSLGVETREGDVDRGSGWKFEREQEEQLRQFLSSSDRPTAVFAAGYYYALGVYAIAASVGLTIPRDLSVVSVDDPASAEHLSPPLTTVRQPLMHMGRMAVRGLFDLIGEAHPTVQMTKLKGELVVRQSTAKAQGLSAISRSSGASGAGLGNGAGAGSHAIAMARGVTHIGKGGGGA